MLRRPDDIEVYVYAESDGNHTKLHLVRFPKIIKKNTKLNPKRGVDLYVRRMQRKNMSNNIERIEAQTVP